MNQIAARRRFEEHRPVASDIIGLQPDHDAVTGARTIFPTTVRDDWPRLLISGYNSRKIGDMVTKGDWAGFAIYTLTLEERATCPTTCHHWLSCYGNAMPYAHRHSVADKDAFEVRLHKELEALQAAHPGGFVVRLHVLGDFYDLPYVTAWARWLDRFPALHVFGYTAWPEDSEIGGALSDLRRAKWGRFAVRTSVVGAAYGPAAITIDKQPDGDWTAGKTALVCPAQTGKADCCGSCGLCWSPAMKQTPIAFIRHGMRRAAGRRGRKPVTREEPMTTVTQPPSAIVSAAQIEVWRRERDRLEKLATDVKNQWVGLNTLIAAAEGFIGLVQPVERVAETAAFQIVDKTVVQDGPAPSDAEDPPRQGRPLFWTPAKITQLRVFVGKGMSDGEIGRKLGTTGKAIENKRSRLRLRTGSAIAPTAPTPEARVAAEPTPAAAPEPEKFAPTLPAPPAPVAVARAPDPPPSRPAPQPTPVLTTVTPQPFLPPEPATIEQIVAWLKDDAGVTIKKGGTAGRFDIGLGPTRKNNQRPDDVMRHANGIRRSAGLAPFKLTGNA